MPAQILVVVSLIIYKERKMHYVLKRENEVLLSQKARQIGIVVSERYYSTMDLNDKHGVKAYSEYAELPVYVARNGRYEKITL